MIKNRKYEIDAKFILNEHPKYKYLPGVYAGLKFKYLSYDQRVSLDTVNNRGTSKYTGTYLTAGTFNMDSTTMFNFDIWGSFCLAGEYSADYSLEGRDYPVLEQRKKFLRHRPCLAGNAKPRIATISSTKGTTTNGRIVLTRYTPTIYEGIIRTNAFGQKSGWPSTTRRTIFISTQPLCPVNMMVDLMVFTAWAKQIFRLGTFLLRPESVLPSDQQGERYYHYPK